MKSLLYYQEKFYVRGMEKVMAEAGNRTNAFQGELIELPGINHYAYQVKISEQLWLIVSMQNEIIQEDDEEHEERNENNSYFGDEEEVHQTLPSLHEYLENPNKFKSMLHQKQLEIINQGKEKQRSKGEKKSKPKNEKEPSCKYEGNLKICISRKVGCTH